MGAVLSRGQDWLASALLRLLQLYRSGWRARLLTHGLVSLGVLWLALRWLHRRYVAKYQVDFSASQLRAEYDYIVVGAGSAGCALAARLSEDADVRVLLIEAGGSDDVREIDCPAAAIKLQRKAQHDWCYSTTPQAHAHMNMRERVGHWPRGKVLGGCSSLNYMLYVRGAPADFDSWAAMGCGEDWNYANVLPFFKRMESVTPETSTVPPSTWRGTDGPMPCNHIISPQATTHAFLDSAVSSGVLQKNVDYNGESIFGVGMTQYNVKHGRRINTATAYLQPVLHRPNLHILTQGHVTRVLFSPAKEAIGVALKRGTDPAALKRQNETVVRASREVILCAGAVGSPQLLELSGVGRRDVLGAAGVPLVHELAGVGENLQDHMSLPVFFESKHRTLSSADETLRNIYEYLRHGTGPLTGNMVEALGWLKTPAHAGAKLHPSYAHACPDIQFHFLCGSITADEMHAFNACDRSIDNFRKLAANGVKWTNAIMPTLLHPQSVGSIHITSSDALQAPRIDPNYLSRPEDVASLVHACLLVMRIYEEAPIRALTGRYLGDEIISDNPFDRHTQPLQYWEHYVRSLANTLYHPVGTCKMGAADDESAVVDPQLRVRGVSRLRVCDASVMPMLPSGNTNVPAIMIGEKCADLIKRARKEENKPKQEATKATPAKQATSSSSNSTAPARSKL